MYVFQSAKKVPVWLTYWPIVPIPSHFKPWSSWRPLENVHQYSSTRTISNMQITKPQKSGFIAGNGRHSLAHQLLEYGVSETNEIHK